MSDQILTQEEIDALLSAMDRGEVDVAEEAQGQSEVVAYSLTSTNVMLRDQFSALEEVYDKFATLLDTSISSLLQRSIEVEFLSTEMVKYQEWISAFSSPTNFNIFSMDPLVGSALLAVEPELIFSIIDCMFGGEGKPISKVREFTLIEQRMIKKFASEILSQFEQAWKIVDPIRITLKKSETKPEYVHLCSPNDLMVVIVFSINGEQFSGNFHMCLSYMMLEPIKEKLSAKYLREKDLENTWGGRIENLLQDTPVTMIAELGHTTRTVRDLLNLKLDDVIQLDTGPEDQVRLTVDHVPKYLGYPGIIKGNRAVEVDTLLRKNGGEK